MGNFQAIEQEEKVFKMDEQRNEIYESIKAIEEIKSEEGQQELADLTEKFEATFNEDSDDEDGISDKNVILTKLPWAKLERAEDKESL